MTQADVIVEMLNVSKDVIKHYWTDISHDAKLIAEAKTGDTFLWAPYTHGTRIILISRGKNFNDRAKSSFEAMNTSEVTQWYHITIGDITCMFNAIDKEYSELIVDKAMQQVADGNRISELHM